ncbi:MAG: hypothetical protein H7144_01130 [Burkholderiales bacterium]|nr:hypothetical protein [Phycisphaerae bacterium]
MNFTHRHLRTVAVTIVLACLCQTAFSQTQKKGEAPTFMENDDAWFASPAGIE